MPPGRKRRPGGSGATAAVRIELGGGVAVAACDCDGMAKQFPSLLAAHRKMIGRHHIFFTATAATEGRVNVSPRPADAFRVIDEVTVCYRDLTGSGNETSAHLRVNDRMTIMFCSFAGPPTILRLYGRGKIFGRKSASYTELLANHFAAEEPPGTRQIVVLDIDLVQTSCGYGVPLFDYRAERDTLARWAEAKGEDALEKYRLERNAVSIDGLPAGA